ncbi:MAG TPA: circadian clock protein KaiC [Longimicrobiaceae bacterium]|nr:circadian clock protein KaiC [Longimicrobiaceae bacterium]
MSHTAAPAPQPVTKLHTGIPGFDTIAEGGLPRGRTTLIAGTAGSAKTVLATHFLVSGIREADQPGVFITFEDSPDDIRRNVLGFGWDIAALEAEGKWAFVDAALRTDDEPTVVGEYDLGGLLARVEHAVRSIGAKRVVLDSVNALFARFSEHGVLRAELFRISASLKEMGATVVFTAERTEEYGEVSRHGIEEFVADNVLILRNLLQEERRRRTVEILKFRGASHQRGEFPFTVSAGRGITVLPLSAMELTQASSDTRVTSGLPELDAMVGGGYFRDSVILLSGATGTGKTLTVTHFVQGGYRSGDRTLLFAFEESREQLARNARSWGVDFDRMEREGKLRVVPVYPHAMPIEDHLLRMRDTIDEFRPRRVVVDSLSALERVTSLRSFREFIINLTSFIKHREMVGMFTSTASKLSGGDSVTEKHISTLTDTILLLRYVEHRGELRRGMLVLKMRGSPHEKTIREFAIDGTGMHIGAPFRGISGLLTGAVSHDVDGDDDREADEAA